MKRQNHSLEKLLAGAMALLLSMSLCACGSTGGAGRTETQPAEPTTEAASEPQTTEEQTVSPSPTAEATTEPETAETAAEAAAPEAEENDEDIAEAPLTGIRPEFQAAMDSYEAFYDEYCTLLEQYQENPTDFGVLTQYTEMMSRIAEMDEAFEAWDDEEMSNEELAYYLEVSARIQQRLAKMIAD